MNKYIIIMEYQSKVFMDLNGILTFKYNLEKIKNSGISVNLVFYGNYSNEELSVFMSYLNRLLQDDICEIAISTKTKNICYIKKDGQFLEGGANFEFEKISEKNIKDLKNNKFDNIIKKYYSPNQIKIKYWSTTNWENTILELIDT